MSRYIPNIPSIDWKLSLTLATEQPKLALNLFEMMIASFPAEKQLINQALKEQNWLKLREHIHRLQGGCCYTGFPKLKYILKQLQQEIICHNHNKILECIILTNQEINFLLSNYHQLKYLFKKQINCFVANDLMFES